MRLWLTLCWMALRSACFELLTYSETAVCLVPWSSRPYGTLYVYLGLSLICLAAIDILNCLFKLPSFFGAICSSSAMLYLDCHCKFISRAVLPSLNCLSSWTVYFEWPIGLWLLPVLSSIDASLLYCLHLIVQSWVPAAGPTVPLICCPLFISSCATFSCLPLIATLNVSCIRLSRQSSPEYNLQIDSWVVLLLFSIQM